MAISGIIEEISVGFST